MPLVEQGFALPSTLADLIGQVKDAFDAMGDATPIMVGRQYLRPGAGSAPRVVFVPEQGGRLGDPQELGSAASNSHGCEVRVRAPESGDDIERYRAAYLLGDRVVDCIATAGTGRIEWRNYEDRDESPVDVDAGFGAGVAFSFVYTRDVRHDPTRWALPPATDDTSAAVPLVPPGEPADGVEPTFTVVPTE